MADISGFLTAYFYVLFGGLLFVVILAALRAVGGAETVIHHEISGGHGEVGEHDISHGDHAEGHSDNPNEPVANPGLLHLQGMTLMTISIFLVGFAAFGILSLYYVVGPYNLDPVTSIPISVGAAAALALGLGYAAFKYFIATAAGSEITTRELVGRAADVTLGASGTELGEIQCNVKGQIMSYPARSGDGTPLRTGETCQIMRMVGNVAIVSRRKQEE